LPGWRGRKEGEAVGVEHSREFFVARKHRCAADKESKDTQQKTMSALFDFSSFLSVVLLTICTCTFVRMRAPGMLSERTG
jgi:hypothetical protein